MIIQKPKYTSDEIWAGGKNTPDVSEPRFQSINPGEGEKLYKESGWIYGQKPPYNFVNWSNKHKDEMLVHLNQAGIINWDRFTGYQEHAFVNYRVHGQGYTFISKNEIPEIQPVPNSAPVDDLGNPNNDWSQITNESVPEWYGYAGYSTNDKVNYNGNTYQAQNNIAEPSGNNPPATWNVPNDELDIDPDWIQDIDMTSDNIVKESNGPVDADKLTMTSADGKLHHSLMSIGILQFRGGIDITQTAPLEIDTTGNGTADTPIETGDIFTITNDPSDTYDSTFDPLTGLGYRGEGIIAKVDDGVTGTPTQAQVQWYRMGSGLNSNYLLRDGSQPMVDQSAQGGGNGELILSISGEPSADKAAISKKYVRDTYVQLTDYEDIDVLNKIKNVDGHGSGLDSDLLDGKHGSEYIQADGSIEMDSGYVPLDNPDVTTKRYVDEAIAAANGTIVNTKDFISIAGQIDFILSGDKLQEFSVSREGILIEQTEYSVNITATDMTITLNDAADEDEWVSLAYYRGGQRDMRDTFTGNGTETDFVISTGSLFINMLYVDGVLIKKEDFSVTTTATDTTITFEAPAPTNGAWIEAFHA